MRGLSGLKRLDCHRQGDIGKGKLIDLSPLKDMKLTDFD